MKRAFKHITAAMLVTAFVTGVTAPLSALAKDVPTAAMKSTETDNRELVSAYLHALFVERDLSKVEGFWDKDMIQHNPMMPNGLNVLRGIMGKIGPDFRYEQGLIAQEGKFVMVHGRYTGWGPKPMVAVDIFRIESGKVVEHWDVMQEETPKEKSVNGNTMFPAR